MASVVAKFKIELSDRAKEQFARAARHLARLETLVILRRMRHPSKLIQIYRFQDPGAP